MSKRFVVIVLLAMVLVGAVASPGYAVTYRVEDLIVGFGVAYLTPAGESRTHRGVDVAGSEGDSVVSPSAGTVSFAGRVPGANGGTVLAVTMEGPAGKISLMPFDDVVVEKGQVLSEGDEVGTLSGSGDYSSDEPHLHLSLRTGDLYLDPSGLLCCEEPSPASSFDSEGPPVESVTDEVVGPVSTAPEQPVTLAVASEALVPVQSSTTVAQPVAAPSASPVGAESSLGGSTVQAGQGVSLAPRTAVTEPRVASAVPVPTASSVMRTSRRTPPVQSAARAVNPRSSLSVPRQSIAPQGVLRRFDWRVGRLPAIGAPTLAALLALGIGAALMLRMRAFERRLRVNSRVSRRLGSVLQQLRTGATLRGFTSCPGLTAFTVPGPSSPGEVTK